MIKSNALGGGPTFPVVISRLTQWHYLLAIATIVVFVAAAVFMPAFLTTNNLSQMAAGVSERALVVFPMALIIIAREIDLSVASVIGLGSVTLGVLLQAGVALPLALAVTIVVGGIAGAFNGFFIAYLGLPSMVVTLGSLALFRGICYIVLGSESISVFPDELVDFGYGYLGSSKVPLTIIPFVVVGIAYAVLLHRTSVGRRVYAVGGNPEAALYSGLNVRNIKMWLFITAGMIAALAGVVYTARLSSSRADNAFGMELDIITVVFLGGVSMLGGRGTIPGVAWAMGLVAVVRNVMGLNGVGGDVQGTVIGLILVGSLLLTNLLTNMLARVNNQATDLSADTERTPEQEELPEQQAGVGVTTTPTLDRRTQHSSDQDKEVS